MELKPVLCSAQARGYETAELRTRSGKPKVDWGRYGRGPVLVLALVAFIDSVDRGILPGVLSLVQKDLGFSDSQAGVLGSVFIFMSFLVVIPAGYMADRLRRTRVIAFALASWGVISAINATVRTFWQFLSVRAVLGAGEAVNGPSGNSLLADYYPAAMRGRAYAYTRVAPTVGYAVGLGVGGAVGSLWGWRAAFLVVGVPGSLLAFWALRLADPGRGESDKTDTSDSLLEEATRRGFDALMKDVRIAARVPSLRALMIGTAISTGAISGIGYWSAPFYERHTSLGSGGAAEIVGVIILFGAVIGTLAGGRAADRARAHDVGAPMRLAGITQFIAGVILAITFLHMPLVIRLPMQLIGVAFIVAAFPALSAMTSQVVPSAIRGTAFAVTGFLSALASAISPLLIGVIADQFPIVVDGKTKGNLATAFLIVIPLVGVGSLIVLNGRRHVAGDIEHVGDLEHQLSSGEVAEHTVVVGQPPVTSDRTNTGTAAIRIVVMGIAFLLATWGEVIAAKGGKLPFVPWTLDGGLETAVLWGVCAYPIALIAGHRIATIIARPFSARPGDRTDRLG